MSKTFPTKIDKMEVGKGAMLDEVAGGWRGKAEKKAAVWACCRRMGHDGQGGLWRD